MIKLKTILKETNEVTMDDSYYPPMMYSEKGFSCKACKFLNYNKEENRWTCANTDFQKYQESIGIEKSRSHYLLDDKGNPIEDPSKWCSNWFKPRV